MRKGKSLGRITAGVVAVTFAAACGGGDAPDAGGGEVVPPVTQPEASGPVTTVPSPTADPVPEPEVPTEEAPAAEAPPSAAAPAAPAATQADPPAAAAPAANAELIAQGEQTYRGSICVSCHGPTGGGTPLGPALNDGEWSWVEAGEDMEAQVATVIRTGVLQPRDPSFLAPMLPFGGGPQMNDSQVEALAAYIVSMNR